MQDSNIHIQQIISSKISIITLQKPETLNALSYEFLSEIADALIQEDQNEHIHCIVLKGTSKAFAAGADIKTLSTLSPMGVYTLNMYDLWQKIKQIKKPIIAMVQGFALGGGCELAMHCDIIYAGESAVFGQPEINLGIMPGAGGTQRLTHLIGKHLAMEYILTGQLFSAYEALKMNMINKVIPDDVLEKETIKLANTIASKSLNAIKLAKESILKSFDLTLQDGLLFERRNYSLTFDTAEQKDLMKGFLEKSKK